MLRFQIWVPIHYRAEESPIVKREAQSIVRHGYEIGPALAIYTQHTRVFEWNISHVSVCGLKKFERKFMVVLPRRGWTRDETGWPRSNMYPRIRIVFYRIVSDALFEAVGSEGIGKIQISTYQIIDSI